MEEKWKTMRKSIVNKIMEKENIEKYFCVPKKGWSGYGKSQYRGIYWIRLSLSDNIIKSLKDTQYAGATAIHIMPYCITAEDVKKAEEKYIKGGEECFYCRGPLFVDYDPNSGNFHKKIKYEDYNIDDIYPQVVLVAEGTDPAGPGWRNKPIRPSGWFDFSWVEKENRLNAIKTHWYFPPIREKNEKYEKSQTQNDFKAMIEKLLNDVKNAIQEEINKKNNPTTVVE